MNASSNFAAVTFFTVFKMCRHRVNAVINVKILFGKITHFTDREIRKKMIRDLYENENFGSILVQDLLTIGIQIQFLHLTIALN